MDQWLSCACCGPSGRSDEADPELAYVCVELVLSEENDTEAGDHGSVQSPSGIHCLGTQHVG